ncbi:MAG TPA: metallophosphoesterase [Candidatus Deferrimicrobium sp.]|nr:metallophosphoesterase [Candidatus Deferrimicrobium sp.]
MLRILAISDIHAQFSELEEIVEHVANLNLQFDMIIVAGDFSANTHEIPSQENPQVLSRIVEVLENGVVAPIYGVLGNDDDPSLDLEQYGIHSLENKVISIGNWNFVGWGGAPDYVIIPSPPEHLNEIPKKRELDGVNLWKDDIVIPTMAPILDKIPKNKPLCMVTHYHADAVFPSRGRHPLLGSKGLKAVLVRYRPDLWLCGHIHPQVGFKNWFKPTQTLLIRVTCVKADTDKFTGKPFGKVYWILELEDNGQVNTSFKMLSEVS